MPTRKKPKSRKSPARKSGKGSPRKTVRKKTRQKKHHDPKSSRKRPPKLHRIRKKVATARKKLAAAVRPSQPESAAALPQKYVETSVDRLYGEVRSRGSMGLTEASTTLKVKEERVEEWALILEEHKLIRMNYPKFGKPVMLSLEYRKHVPKTKASGRSRGHRKAVMLVLAVIMAVGLASMALFMMYPDTYLSGEGNQYLIPVAILILFVLLLLGIGIRKRRREHGSKGKV